MIHRIPTILEIITAIGSVASLGYYAVALWSGWAFLRRQQVAAGKQSSSFTPPVSILKPLKGTDPGMYESFRSQCLQEYPEYEILFGVSEPDDPAIALVERLKMEFPKCAIRVVHCSRILGTNVKVSNLAQMVPEARYEYLIVNDSDIRVENDYLRKVIAPLEGPDVGLVTCLYRGAASATLGSRLEALGISSDFIPGVLTAWKLESGIHFGLGSTLAFRKTNLRTMGGFEALLDYLADDYQLGKRMADQGLRIVLSQSIVETHLPTYSMAGYLRHQLRWARTVRDSRRWGYVGTGITFGLTWSVALLLFSGGANWAWGVFAAVLYARIAVAIQMGSRILQDSSLYRRLGLLPLRDGLGLGVWFVSFFGHTISWRGTKFALKDGRLIRTPSGKLDKQATPAASE